MEEYERTMSALISEREIEQKQWAEEKVALLRERDEANEHLANMEHSFNDIHALVLFFLLNNFVMSNNNKVKLINIFITVGNMKNVK